MNSQSLDKPAVPFLSWWRTHLRPVEDTASARALRARLRRADSVLDVLAEAEVHRLAAAVPYMQQRPDILADIVCTLALVEEYDSRRLAWLLGSGQGESAFSSSRFGKLMRASRGELRVALRRALPMAGFRCNGETLAQDILNWDDENTRRRWWFDYFHTSAPPPTSEAQTKEQAV